MRNLRALTLRKETLAELGPDRLAAVAAGAVPSGPTCPPDVCTGITTAIATLKDCFSQPHQTCGCCTATASCEV